MEQSDTALKALSKMRAILEEHISREERWWSSLSERDRKGILRLAAINTGFSLKEWNEIAPSIRYRIIETAIRASEWANQILSCPHCLRPCNDS